MSQNREKEETLDIKLTSSLCPENCKLSANTNTNAASNSQICASPDLGRPDPTPGLSLPPPETPADAPEPELPAVSRKAVNRCLCCAKRVGLTGFRCRCGELFCAVHRYTDRHDCSFDYKAAGREAIARENPVVRAAKILKV